MADIDAKK